VEDSDRAKGTFLVSLENFADSSVADLRQQTDNPPSGPSRSSCHDNSHHVALGQLDSVDTGPMDACNALTAPSEGVRRGHVNAALRAQILATEHWSLATRSMT
jgi:hypothetical protein